MDAGEGEVRVQAVEGLAHVAQLARVVLHATVRETLEERGEAEPLQLVGGGAVAVDVLLRVFRKAREQLLRLPCLSLHQQALSPQQLVGHARLAHVGSFLGKAPSSRV